MSKVSSEKFEIRGLPWSPDQLPASWSVTSLAGLLKGLNSGFACGRNEQLEKGLIHLRPMNISPDGRIDLSDVRFVPASAGSQRLVSGDVLFNNTNSGVWVGKTALMGDDCAGFAFSNHMTRLRVEESVLNADFLARQLNWLRTHGYFAVNCNKHVNQASISGDFLRTKLPIALPPLAEQRRIVARLEALEARSRRARALLAEVPAHLAQARQSLLAAAFRGDLTAEWRVTAQMPSSAAELFAALQQLHADAPQKKGNAANASEGVHDLDQANFPSTWVVTELRVLCRPDRPICYGILMPGPEQTDGVPYIRVADFPRDVIRLETVRKTTAKIDAQFARSRLSTGDILLSIRGTTGRIAFVPPELDGANITQDSARLSIHPSVDARFVALMMRSPDTQKRMQRAVKGVAVRGLNIGDVRPLQIPLPPLPEQHEIVRRLSAALARLDAAARAHAAAVAELDRLDQSLLARAFSGTLVPQDPADVPLGPPDAKPSADTSQTSGAARRTLSDPKKRRNSQ